MNNADFWASVHSIIAEGFTPEGLHKLDSYAEQFISGRLVYQRFSPQEQHGCSAGGATNVIASMLAGAETGTDSQNQGALSDYHKQGEFKIIAEQPYIDGQPVSDEDIADYMRQMGFELKNPRNWTYATPDIYLSDMHDENVIRSNKSDTLFVVDCDIRINTPELRQGGTRALSTEVRFIDDRVTKNHGDGSPDLRALDLWSLATEGTAKQTSQPPVIA
jgi:hypothetical protein